VSEADLAAKYTVRHATRKADCVPAARHLAYHVYCYMHSDLLPCHDLKLKPSFPGTRILEYGNTTLTPVELSEGEQYRVHWCAAPTI